MITRKVMQSSQSSSVQQGDGPPKVSSQSRRQVFSGNVPENSWIRNSIDQSSPLDALPPPMPGSNPEAPQVTKQLNPVSCKPGEDAVFEAVISGNPVPKISWLKEQSPLTPSPQKYEMSFEPDGTARLRVKAAHQSDAANYFLLAENQFGRLQTGANLFINDCTGAIMPPGPSMPGLQLTGFDDLTSNFGNMMDLRSGFGANMLHNDDFFGNHSQQQQQLFLQQQKAMDDMMRSHSPFLMAGNTPQPQQPQQQIPVEQQAVHSKVKPQTVVQETQQNVQQQQQQVQQQNMQQQIQQIQQQQQQQQKLQHQQQQQQQQQTQQGTYQNVFGRSIPPTIIGAPAVIASAQHQTACIEMTFEADPCPTIAWSRDGVSLAEGAKYNMLTSHSDGNIHVFTLVVNNIEVGDQGKYTCVAENEGGGTQIGVGLRLQHKAPSPPPAPTFSKLFNDINVEEGSDVELRVAADENAPNQTKLPLIFQWFKDQQPLCPSQKIRITTTQKESVLIIKNVTLADTGYYGIMAVISENGTPSTHQTYVNVLPATAEQRLLRQQQQQQQIQSERFLQTKQEQLQQRQQTGVQPVVNTVPLEVGTPFGAGGTPERSIPIQMGVNKSQVQERTITNQTQITKNQQERSIPIQFDQPQQLPAALQPRNVPIQFEQQQQLLQQQQQHVQQSANVPGTKFPLPQFVTAFVAGFYDVGSRVILTAKVTPQAGPVNFHWERDDKPLEGFPGYKISNSEFETTLTIDSFTPDKAGAYVCTAIGQGGANSHGARIGTKEAAQQALPVFTERFPAQFVPQSQPLSLTCRVEPEQRPVDFVWHKDGVPIDPDSITPYRITSSNFDTTLTFVSGFSAPDAATYSCIATNPGGSNTHKAPIYLKPSEPAPPQLPPSQAAPDQSGSEPLPLPPMPVSLQQYVPSGGPAPRPPGPPPPVCPPPPPVPSSALQSSSAGPQSGQSPKPNGKPENYRPSPGELMSQAQQLKRVDRPLNSGPLPVNTIVSPPKPLPTRLPGATQLPVNNGQRNLPMGKGNMPFDPRELELVELRHVESDPSIIAPEATKVFDPPTFLSNPADAVLVEGARAQLECQFLPRDDPSMRIIWLLNGKELCASSRIVVMTDFGRASLTLNGVQASDTGIYTCRATNAKGQAEVTAELSVTEDRGVVTSSIFESPASGSQPVEALVDQPPVAGRPNWAVQRKME